MTTEATPREVGSHEGLGPLPEPTQGLGAHRWAYSAEQMRAYAAQEVASARQRISALMEAHIGIRLATVEYLEAMRQGPTPQEWSALDAEPRA